MKSISLGVLCVLLLLVATGCSKRPVVAGIPHRDSAVLTSDEIVSVMARAGFGREEILELGPGLRNTLATAGSGRIQYDGQVEAIFSVDNPYLYVSSQRRGSFIFKIGPDK